MKGTVHMYFPSGKRKDAFSRNADCNITALCGPASEYCTEYKNVFSLLTKLLTDG